MLWDVFCRVIDHHGDLGVCWRLAAQLAARGQRVRLWADDASALAWMAPAGAAGVEVVAWSEAPSTLEPGEVVVEAFGCDPPSGFVQRMQRDRPPLWLNLEYLSAESYVERSHGLPSPQGNGLVKWFYYPGFGEATGGLLREADAIDARRHDEGRALLASLGAGVHDGERCVSLFCYPHAPFAELLARLADEPTHLIVAAGAGQAGAMAAIHAQPWPTLRATALPWLTQPDYDRLLGACDLNFARGEDSILRAMWAGAPFVWHIYRQHDGAHAAKLDALLDRMEASAPVRALWRAWNGLGPWPQQLPEAAAWRREAVAWRDALAAQRDLVTRLLQFAAEKGVPG